MKKIFFLGIITTVVAVLGIGLTSSTASAGQVLQVGAGKPYKTPSAAAKVAKNGDVVEIDASTYWGDVAVWRQDDITLRGVGGRAHLKARGKTAQGKAIWVIKGNNITVENMEFSGARVADKNGAGIRFEGAGLTIRNSHFHHNEIGILVNGDLASDILIEGSEFHHNTLANQRYFPPGHNIYVGKVRRFTLRNSYVHHASVGHNVKSRARENYILYNRIMDENGSSSYLLDLAEGGDAYVIGNVFQQSAYTENNTMVSYAAEANRNNPSQYLYMVNNTLVNDAGKGTFVNNHSVAPATLINNLCVGNGAMLRGPGTLDNNLVTEDAGFSNPADYDYRLMQDSVAIDQGTWPGSADNGFSLQPLFHYVHPLNITPRFQDGVLDVGAYEAEATASQIIKVGPERFYKTPREAANEAIDGDVVEIDAGTYWGDVAVWSQDNITLRGVGGRAHLKARGKTAQGKAIWVIKGNNVTVENMEFSGARVADKNGAGIRFEGAGLTIRNSHFHHNERGVLINGNLASDILIAGSEFNDNTVDYQRYGRLGHNIYIGRVRRFTLRNSYVHHASVGHNVKSYAQENYILYNRIMDEELGNSSYLLDLAEGGDAYVIGNVFQQSQYTDNYTMVSYAAEANRNDASQYLYFVNNTLVNDAGKGTFVNNHSVAPATLLNNLWVGNGKILQGFGDELAGNIITQNAGFVNPAGYDYRLMQGSVAIDQGVEPGYAHNGFSLQPLFHYVHPLEVTTRPLENECDVGAYEFTFNRW